MNQSIPTKTKIRKNRLKLWKPHRVLGGPSLEAGVFQKCLISMKNIDRVYNKFSDICKSKCGRISIVLRKFCQILKEVEVYIVILTLCYYIYDYSFSE